MVDLYVTKSVDDKVNELSERVEELADIPAGADAYQIAVEAGFVGTRDLWLKSLKSTTPGRGITSIADPDTSGTAVVTYTDGTVDELPLPEGPQGAPGGSDAATATWIEDGSETRAALEAVVGRPLRDDLATIRANQTYSSGAVVTFIDDDCDPLWADVWGPICSNHSIKMSLCAIGSRASGVVPNPAYPSMDVDQLRDIESAGHDILSHGWAHLTTTSATPEEIDEDFALARSWMDSTFPRTADAVVYPGGLHGNDVAKKSVTRKHFRYGISTTSSPAITTQPCDNWYIGRVNGDTSTESQLKAHIDNAIAQDGWLIVMTHAKELDALGRSASMTKLSNVIAYAKGLGVRVLPWSEAEKIKGNAIAVGEFTAASERRRLFVSHQGRMTESPRSGDARGVFLPTVYGAAVAGEHAYSSAYPRIGFWSVSNGLAFIRGSLRVDVGGWDAACAGALRIGGFPANMSLRDTLGAPVQVTSNFLNLGAGYTQLSGRINIVGGGGFMHLLKHGSGVSENYVNAADIDPAKVVTLHFSGVYMATDQSWTLL